MEDFDLKKYLAEGKLHEEQMDSSTVDIKLLLLDLRNTIADFDDNKLTAQEFRDEITTILYEVENSNLYNLREADQDVIKNEAEINENDNPDQNQKNDLEYDPEDDSYTTYCDLCDMSSTYSDDTPYGTCMCS